MQRTHSSENTMAGTQVMHWGVSQKTENLLNIQLLADWLNQSRGSQTRTHWELLARRWQPLVLPHGTLPGRYSAVQKREGLCMHASASGTKSTSGIGIVKPTGSNPRQAKESAHRLTLFGNICVCGVHSKKPNEWNA